MVGGPRIGHAAWIASGWRALRRPGHGPAHARTTNGQINGEGMRGRGGNGRRTGWVVAGRCTVKPQAAGKWMDDSSCSRKRPEDGWEKSYEGEIGWWTSAHFVHHDCAKLGRA